jgi:hypothetical protein
MIDWLKTQVERTIHKLWPGNYHCRYSHRNTISLTCASACHINHHNIDSTVDLFGSSVTRLCEEKGDVDLVICLPSRIRLKPRVIVAPPSNNGDKKDKDGKDRDNDGGDVDDDDDDGDDHDHDHDEHDTNKLTSDSNAVDEEPLPPGMLLQLLIIVTSIIIVMFCSPINRYNINRCE